MVVLVHSPPALTTIKKMDCFDNKQKKWLTPKTFVNSMDCFDDNEKKWLTSKNLVNLTAASMYSKSMGDIKLFVQHIA